MSEQNIHAAVAEAIRAGGKCMESPTPGERFRWVIRAALECENAGVQDAELERIALTIGRWLKWNAPDGAGSDWFGSLAGEDGE